MDAKTRETVFLTPPQLSAQNTLCTTVDVLACRLYVLLSNGHVHVWQLSASAPPRLHMVCTTLEREGLTTLALLSAAAVPRAAADLMCLNRDASGEVADHLIASNRDGDIIVLDASTLDIVLRFSAHKLCHISHLRVDAEHRRLLSVAGSTVKLWDLARPFKLIRASDLDAAVTHVAALNDAFFVTTADGKLSTVDMGDGAVLASDAIGHSQPATALTANPLLQHLVSSSSDGTLKLWSANRTLSRALLIGQSLTCACFLNDGGDLLVGIDQKLVAIQASTYRKVAAAEKDERAGTLRCDLTSAAASPAALCRHAGLPCVLKSDFRSCAEWLRRTSWTSCRARRAYRRSGSVLPTALCAPRCSGCQWQKCSPCRPLTRATITCNPSILPPPECCRTSRPRRRVQCARLQTASAGAR